MKTSEFYPLTFQVEFSKFFLLFQALNSKLKSDLENEHSFVVVFHLHCRIL